jgi:glutamate formiminotransferase / formiminotetrahydrofolate cyclodeaminase
LGERVGTELQIPVYLYEASQPNNARNNLSIIRSGEYEGFFDKIKLPEWTPDYGPIAFDAKRGATVIGGRDYLIAYNINLNTPSVKFANTILVNGIKTKVPGSLKYVKAIGWYIKEYRAAQVSMNLTKINHTPIHIVFDEVSDKANDIGIRVTGSELVGLIPLQCMIDAGNYFLKKQNYNDPLSEEEIINIAIKTMGLAEVKAFNPQERIIEYVLSNKSSEIM